MSSTERQSTLQEFRPNQLVIKRMQWILIRPVEPGTKVALVFPEDLSAINKGERYDLYYPEEGERIPVTVTANERIRADNVGDYLTDRGILYWAGHPMAVLEALANIHAIEDGSVEVTILTVFRPTGDSVLDWLTLDVSGGNL